MQGRIAIFDSDKPLKMEESENRIFLIPSRESPGRGFYDILQRGVAPYSVSAAWAAASLATGIRGAEQDT